MQESTFCLKLLKFVVENINFIDIRDCAKSLNQFIVNELKEKGCFLVEIPNSKNNKDKNFVRSHTNKALWDEFREVLTMEVLQKFTKQKKGPVKIQNQYFYQFFFEGYKTNGYLLVLPIDEKTSQFNVFFQNLCVYLSQLTGNIKKWTELNDYKNLIYRDDVTSLYNQRKLHLDLNHCIERFQKFEEVFHIYFIDIDHFKTVNDGHGHLVGTHLLSQVGDIIKQQLRDTDYVYRYGGDEFVAIVPDVSKKVALKIGERLLDEIKSKDYKVTDLVTEKVTKFQLSVSIGIASYPEDASTKERIIDLADRMMYHAKSTGRGKVCQASKMFAKQKAK